MNKRLHRKKQTIIYVNFSPYENTGKILDYILDNFTDVLVFSLNFHQLGPMQSSRLILYRRGEKLQSYKLGQISVPPHLVFFMLPIRSLYIFLQIIFRLLWLKRIYRSYDIYISVNAFTIWIGNFLKKVGLVSKTIFWVWDYYPPIHENKVIALMRWIYWQFDKLGVHSDKIVFLNERLQNLRKDIGILPRRSHYTIVPIGTNPTHRTRSSTHSINLVFLGVLKKSQGIGLIFRNAKKIFSKFPDLTVDIIGSGPDEQFFKNQGASYDNRIRFHGYLSDETEMNRILQRADIGLAMYVPEESNVSYYGDPSKIKAYLNFGLPVITTNVFAFATEIQNSSAGVIIDYYKPKQFLTALSTILKNYSLYQSGAKKLAAMYKYTSLYHKIFFG